MLDVGIASYASDMYSFGVIMWEVLSRDVPWGREAHPRDIMTRVFKGDRLPIGEHFPDDLAKVMQACWSDEPESRPEASEILGRLELHSGPKKG